MLYDFEIFWAFHSFASHVLSFPRICIANNHWRCFFSDFLCRTSVTLGDRTLSSEAWPMGGGCHLKRHSWGHGFCWQKHKKTGDFLLEGKLISMIWKYSRNVFSCRDVVVVYLATSLSSKPMDFSSSKPIFTVEWNTWRCEKKTCCMGAKISDGGAMSIQTEDFSPFVYPWKLEIPTESSRLELNSQAPPGFLLFGFRLSEDGPSRMIVMDQWMICSDFLGG